MKIGDRVYTPRFCTVTIAAIFATNAAAREAGFIEPTYYDDDCVFGRHIGTNRMDFAAVTGDAHTCKNCGKDFSRNEMDFTYDCHGITYRLVCQNCWGQLMDKGYDGEYYDEFDERIDTDY